MAELDGAQAQNIRLRFTTREGDLEIGDSAPVLIPTTFRRYQLSQYVNSQLDLGQPIPFEFLINGSYIRTSLEDYLTQNGISAENTLTVEYVRARIPPRYVASYEHDDWLSDVHTTPDDSSEHPRILTASYDGRIRVWNTSSQVLATSAAGLDGGHLSFVKSAKFVTPSQIASASFDRTIKLWKYRDSADGTSADLTPTLELYGHKAGVEAVSASASSNRLLTASADHSVGFWSTKKTDAPPAPENLVPKAITKEGKRRKLNPSVSVAQRGPLSLMRAHIAPVSDARFDLKDSTVGYSSSLDHTVRTWDLVTGAPVDTRTTNNALFCLEQMPALQLLATGSASRDVKLVDPRDSAAAVVAMTLKGHKNHVVTLARDPNNEYVLASGSHDGTCRIWDVRSTKSGKDGVTGQSIFTVSRESLHGKAVPLTGEGIKVFALCWDNRVGLLSAGEDKALQVNRSEDIT
ncbi:ribosome biogenesis protein ytm1 [Knufia obscura]|uniref:Ribosome biogenesis protein YTM1 n=2 Tax=Knufia TaxID=430999 RepID=A0AAN8I2P5_9EURO|nr:ribosome biogenesis protein ytm1 [Knufia obscura]KAK5951677.1 ribosome biogenesis protein ytm1 [Knufia fluminis]